MEGSGKITTISATSEGLYREKGSKFQAYAYPVANEAEIRAILSGLKRDHPKARHICYGCRLCETGKEIMEFIHDAGEPSGSAGLPILNVLRSSGLDQALVVVVRYFGGSKLGIPGLIHAYKTAARDAISNNSIVIRDRMREFKIEIPFEKIDQLYKAVALCEGKVMEQTIDNRSRFRVEIPVRSAREFSEHFPNGKESEDH